MKTEENTSDDLKKEAAGGHHSSSNSIVNMSSTDSKGHVPNALDKWLLVRYKKFPSKAEIPNTVR